MVSPEVPEEMRMPHLHPMAAYAWSFAARRKSRPQANHAMPHLTLQLCCCRQHPPTFPFLK